MADDNDSVMEDEDEATLNTGYVMTPHQMRNMSTDNHNDDDANDFESDEEDVPVAPQGSDLEMGPDLSLADLLNDIVALKVSQFAYLDTDGNIGGASSGAPLLQFEELYDEESDLYYRTISPCRVRREIAGGNIYMPAMLQLLNVNQRKGLDDLRGFPMLMLRTLLTRSGSVDSDKKDLYLSLIRMHGLISVLLSDCVRNIRTLTSHSVRVELYFSSTLQQNVCDIIYPDVDWSSLIGTVDHRELQQTWIANLQAFHRPLQIVIDGAKTLLGPQSTRSPMLEIYPASLKTMLVFCAERLITMLNIRNFEGRITKTLKTIMADDEEVHVFWTIPMNCRTVLTAADQESSGLVFGLQETLLRLPGVDSAFISQMELRTSPSYLQQMNGQLHRELHLPIGYFRYKAKVQALFIKYSLNVRDDLTESFDYGTFSVPGYGAIGRMSEARMTDFLSDLANVLGSCYQAEWWYIVNDRAKALLRTNAWSLGPGGIYRGKLIDFPKTKEELENWITVAGHSTFLVRGAKYCTGVAEVVTVDQFIQLAFLDCAQASSLEKRSRWNRYITRRLMHVICAELSKVEALAAGPRRDWYSVGNFQKAVARHFSRERNTSNDLSLPIIWRTEPGTRMFSWSKFSPLLLEISDSPIPSVQRMVESRQFRTVAPPLFKMPRDHFFRNLLVRQADRRFVQLNRLIVWRVGTFLKENRPPAQNENLLRTNYTIFRLGSESAGLMSLFLDVNQMVDIHHDTHVFLKQKKSGWEDLLLSAEINRDRWPTDPHNLSVDLFKYSNDTEKAMLDLMTNGYWEAAFGMAQDGYLTRHFLLALIRIRQKIVNLRHEKRDSGKTVARQLANLP